MTTTDSDQLSPEVQEDINRLKELLPNMNSPLWEVYDLVFRLRFTHKLSLAEIKTALGEDSRDISRISRYARVAELFPPETRPEIDPFTAEQILEVRRNVPDLEMSPLEMAEEIKEEGLSGRKVKGYFANKMFTKRQSHEQAEAALRLEAPELQTIRGRCFNADWRSVVDELPDNTFKLIHADPPYGQYRKTKDGKYHSRSRDGLRLDSDNETAEQALAVTLPLFELLHPKLAPNGCLLLWQAGNRSDREEVLAVARQHGWHCQHALTWRKPQSPMSNAEDPFVTQSERLLVFCRDGERVVTHNGSKNRSEILEFDSPSQRFNADRRAKRVGSYEVHKFQKPDDLCIHLIERLTHPDEFVLDVFGCSGSFCLAADRIGRPWTYIESNEDNFNWALTRLPTPEIDPSLAA